MIFNPQTGIYEQSCEFPDMYNSNIMSNNSNDRYSGNTCIGGNMAFSPGYKGYDAQQAKRTNDAAIKLQYQEQNARQSFAQREHERYIEKQKNTERLCKIAEQNYKNSAQYASLKEEVKAQKMLEQMQKKSRK